MAEPKILVVGVSWPAETFLHRLLYGLADLGFEITVATTSRPARIDPPHPNLRVLRLGSWNRHPAARWLGLATDTLGALARAPGAAPRRIARALGSREHLHAWHRLAPLLGRDEHVVYFPWNTTAIDYLPVFAPEGALDLPFVVSCRGAQVNTAPHNPARAALRDGLRATFERAAAVHCVSRAIQGEAKRYGLDPEKSWTIHPAVDTERFQPAETPPEGGEFRLVTIGTMIWRKGYEYALMTLRELLDRGIPARFDVIGDGPDYPQVLYTIHDLGLTGRVRLLGKLPPDEVRERLQRSHAFLLSSLSEGISNAVLEAMACGLAVVTTDCGGLREAVTDGEDGRVVPMRDPAAAAAALAELARDPGLCERLGRAARRTVESRFTLARQVESYAEMFRSLRSRASP